MKKYQGLLALGVSAMTVSMAAGQAAFTPGNLLVTQMGDGVTALGTTAAPVFLVEMTPAGSIVQTIPLPTTVSGANRACTTRGSSTAASHLTRSPDGQYAFTVGFDAAVGSADPTATASATVARVVARIAANGTIDTTTALGDAYNTSDIRAAISNNSTDLWVSGNTGSAGTGGARYTTFGGTTSIQLASTPTNLRMCGIYNGQLLVTSATGAFQGPSTVGTGLPTTAGQTVTLLTGFPTAAGPSIYDFWYADDNTLYVSDDATVANGGGLQKWTQAAGTWTKAYTIATGVGTGSGCRGLVGKSVSGVNTLWVTFSLNSQSSVANDILTLVDTGAASTFSSIAIAPALTTYRGLTWVPTGGGPAPCYADCDHVGGLTGNDFQCFLNAFVANDLYANCDGVGGLTGNDFQCFLDKYVAGCS